MFWVFAGAQSLIPHLPKDTFVSLDSASSPSSIFVSKYTEPVGDLESVIAEVFSRSLVERSLFFVFLLMTL